MELLQSIQPFLDWVSAHPQWAGLVIFIVAASESLVLVGILMPGVVLMLGVGALIGLGTLDFWVCFFWTVAGAIAGDGFSYWLGLRYHRQIQSMWPMNLYPDLVPKGEAFFKKHGGKSVFFGRFIGPIRAIIPAVAGIMEMPPAKFYLVNVLSAILWAPVVILPGVAFGASLATASHASTRLVIIAIILAVIIWLLFLSLRKLVYYLSTITNLSRITLAAVLSVLLTTVVGLAGFNVIQQKSQARQAVFSSPVDVDSWLAGGWAELPAYRKGGAGFNDSPFTLQWVDKLQAIETTLSALGWEKPTPLTYASSMLWLSPDAELDKIPLLPNYHYWNIPSLQMTRRNDSGEGVHVLQLWPLQMQSVKLSHRLWVGELYSVNAASQINLFFYPQRQENNSALLGKFKQMLVTGKSNGRLVSRAPGPGLENGKVLLVSNAFPVK